MLNASWDAWRSGQWGGWLLIVLKRYNSWLLDWWLRILGLFGACLSWDVLSFSGYAFPFSCMFDGLWWAYFWQIQVMIARLLVLKPVCHEGMRERESFHLPRPVHQITVEAMDLEGDGVTYSALFWKKTCGFVLVPLWSWEMKSLKTANAMTHDLAMGQKVKLIGTTSGWVYFSFYQ